MDLQQEESTTKLYSRGNIQAKSREVKELLRIGWPLQTGTPIGTVNVERTGRGIRHTGQSTVT